MSKDTEHMQGLRWPVNKRYYYSFQDGDVLICDLQSYNRIQGRMQVAEARKSAAALIALLGHLDGKPFLPDLPEPNNWALEFAINNAMEAARMAEEAAEKLRAEVARATAMKEDRSRVPEAKRDVVPPDPGAA